MASVAFGPELERRALDLAPVMVRDLQGRIGVWTRGMEQLCGYTAAEAIDRIAHELLGTAFPQPLAAIEAEVMDRGYWSGELMLRRRDREVIVVASRWALLRGDDGEPIALTDASTELTKDKRAQEDRQRLVSIIESSQDAIIGKTLEGVVTSWNQAAQDMFGYAAEEIIGRPVATLFPPDRIEEEESILARLRRGERIEHYETVRRRKDGADLHVSLSVSPVRDLSGKVIGASKIVRDVTEQKIARERVEQLQAELMHVSRLKTMSQMASSLAHELNQPLSAVRSYLAAARRLVGSPPADAERIGDILAKADLQAARAGDVLGNLREFVRKGETERRLADLNGVVEEAAALVLIEARHKGISTAMQFADDLPVVLVDRVQIQQVIVNLVRNAVEAMEGMMPRQLTISTRRSGKRGVEVNVADTGKGIAPEVAERLFQPFVTSKRSGMGLGLSICREIMEAHDGRLSAAASSPNGAVFSLWLPLIDESNQE